MERNRRTESIHSAITQISTRLPPQIFISSASFASCRTPQCIERRSCRSVEGRRALTREIRAFATKLPSLTVGGLCEGGLGMCVTQSISHQSNGFTIMHVNKL